MAKKSFLTIIISLLIIALITFSVMGFHDELPWGWLNITIQVVWLFIFVAISAFDVWNKLD